jgi:hypothetical protein
MACYTRCHSVEALARAERKLKSGREQFQKAAARWFRARERTGIPPGFRVVPATVYTDGKRLVVTAHPDHVRDGEDWHNCDAMGCGWEHVIGRVQLPNGKGESE